MTRVRLRRHRIVNRRHAAVAVLALTASLLVGGLAASNATSAPGGPPVEAQVNALLAKMTLEEKLEQMQLLADLQVTDADAQKGVGGVFSLTDPVKINQLPARRGGPVQAAYSDPVRLRHHPRIPDRVPDSARRGEQLRPRSRDRRRHLRRAGDGRDRDQAGLQPRWSTSRTTLGGDAYAEAAGEDPYLGSVMAAARVHGDQGATTARPTRWSPASSTSPRMGSRKAAASTTPPTCRRSVCTTCTCPRTRRRSTPA